jgi:hypothetical protein
MFDRYPIVKLLQVLGVLIGTMTWIYVGGLFFLGYPISVGAVLIGVTLVIITSIIVLSKRPLAAAPPVLLSSVLGSIVFVLFWIWIATEAINSEAATAAYFRAAECGAIALGGFVTLIMFRGRFRVEI